MTEGNGEFKKIFQNHKIIASESRSWYIGAPGTTQHSFSLTWSPGSILLYGQMGNVTLIGTEFRSYETAKKWLGSCELDEFKRTIAHKMPENLVYLYEACCYWGREPHYK
ncbi:MAG: hypothetical protein HQ517_00630 [SAR324 cluster bacterium]|nr:hypothetical protein [SAR324 cluster bacterium]